MTYEVKTIESTYNYFDKTPPLYGEWVSRTHYDVRVTFDGSSARSVHKALLRANTVEQASTRWTKRPLPPAFMGVLRDVQNHSVTISFTTNYERTAFLSRLTTELAALSLSS